MRSSSPTSRSPSPSPTRRRAGPFLHRPGRHMVTTLTYSSLLLWFFHMLRKITSWYFWVYIRGSRCCSWNWAFFCTKSDIDSLTLDVRVLPSVVGHCGVCYHLHKFLRGKKWRVFCLVRQ